MVVAVLPMVMHPVSNKLKQFQTNHHDDIRRVAGVKTAWQEKDRHLAGSPEVPSSARRPRHAQCSPAVLLPYAGAVPYFFFKAAYFGSVSFQIA